uniref:Uncharacterized protein n=1 Tax=Lepeophtheirus salmonis TaxID=72036 RepID=A0A0K2V6I4_LEPSM
MQQLNLRKKI